MPFFYDPNLDDENEDQSSINLSGASANYDNQGNPDNQAAHSDTQSGSGFQNLDKYLQTNNAQAFGQKFQGKVADQVGNAQTQMNQASQDFKTQVDSSNRIPSQEQIHSAISDPRSANKEEFQNWEKQSYSGPKDIAETQDLWNKYWSGAEQAQTNTKLMGTEPGRFTLLDEYFGRPSYNYGEKSLDNLLFQESGLGNETKELQDQATQLKTKGDQNALTLRDYAGQKAGEVEQSKNNTLQAIGLNPDFTVKAGDDAGAIGKLYQQVMNELDQENVARHSSQDAFKSNLSGDAFTPEQLQAMGLSSGQNLFGSDLKNYVNYGNDLTRNQVMSPEERARIQALSELAGINDTFAAGDLEDKTQAYTFDKNRLLSDVGGMKAQYDSDWNKPIVQRPGAAPTSYADLQKFVDMVKGLKERAGHNPNDPSTWGHGTWDETARDYINRINEFNQKNNLGRVIKVK